MESTMPAQVDTTAVEERLALAAKKPEALLDTGAEAARVAGGRQIWGTAAALAGILLIGLAMRAWIIVTPGLGLQSDLNIFSAWSRNLADNGLARFYATQRFCDYPPLGVLTFYGAGATANATAKALGGGGASEELLRFTLKVPACLADLGIALLIFLEARRLMGRRAATAAAALYFLNPVTLYDSAYWGQVDAIYTFFALLALVLVGRRYWAWAGAAAAAGLLAKFQTIAFVPLLIFETYRLGGWRALGAKFVAAVALGVVVLSPFALTGTLADVLQRGYVNVVGQYHQLSKGAFNTWSLIAPPDTIDTVTPVVLARVAAAGQPHIPADSSWLLALSWRRISLIAYALSIAIILAVYSLRPGPIVRYGAAGLLGLAFFLFPTEMHERYAFPVLAFLALWAVSGEWKERVYFLLSAMLLLNLAFVLPPGGLAPQIATVSLLLFGIVLVALARPRTASPAAAPAVPAEVEPEGRASQPLIVWFRRLTVAAVVLAVCGAAALAAVAGRHSATTAAADAVWLSELRPESAEQSWQSLMLDRAVSGGPLTLGETVYLRGLGTHASSRVEYAVPPNATRFRALAGIDQGAGGSGSASVSVEVDGKRVFESSVLKARSEPVEIDLPVAGAKRVVLLADPTPDGQRADHVDWALARFELATAATTQPAED